MKPLTILMIVVSILLSSAAQLLLKQGMSSAHIARLIAEGDYLRLTGAVLQSAWIVGGLLVFAVSVVVWLLVLAKVPVSQAYPFVALGICMTVIGGAWFLDESLTAAKLGGVAFIASGIVLLTRA